MTKKLSVRLLYALALSIILLMTGFLGLGVRAFASAAVTNSIFLVAFGILLVTLPLYFVLRRRLTVTAIDRNIRRLPLIMVPGQKDRRRPLVPGQERAAVAHERRSRQLAGFRVVNLESTASERLRG
jgi:uncharacterized membrane protein YfcA